MFSVWFSFSALLVGILFLVTTNWEILRKRKGYAVFKFLAGYFIGVLVFNIGLVDKTFLAFFEYLGFWLSAAMIAEGFWVMGVKGDVNFRSAAYSLGGVLLLLLYLGIEMFYPMTLAEEKYAASNGALAREKTLEATDEKHLPIVGDDYAFYVANRELSTWKKNISYFELGTGIKQSINGTLYYVFPIEYRGFAKWMKGQSVPGFIEVSAENPNVEPKFVQYDMNYVPSAFFQKNVKRIVRQKNPQALLMEISFEVDDNHKPYYVVPYGHFDSIRNIRQVDGAILVDPKTGEQKKYSLQDVPRFVDQIFPTDVAFERMQWYGDYRDGGWFNAHGVLGTGILASQSGVVEPTDWGEKDGVFGLYGQNGDLSWFSDYTNPTSDSDTMVGFAMMDARTGEISYYEDVSGLSGSDAKGVSQKGDLKAQDLKGNVRGLFQIFGEPTWLVSLEDKSGVYRYTAFVNVKDAQIYSYAKDSREALSDYGTALASGLNSENASATKEARRENISGKVVAVYKKEVKDKTVVQFLLDNSNKIFTVTAGEYPYSMFIETGHTVSVTYIDTKQINASVEKMTDSSINK